MLALGLKLLLAHILGDFVLQPTKWVKHKRKKGFRSPYLLAHIGVHLLALLVLLRFESRYLLGIAFIGITHYAIDLLKIRFTTKKNSTPLFVADQIAHLAVLNLVVYYYTPYTIDFDAIYQPKVLQCSVQLFLWEVCD